MLVGAGIAVLMLFANLAMSHRSRLIGVAILLVPQFYIPGFPVSLAVIWIILTCLAGLTARGRSSADSPLVVIAGLFVLMTATSILWAVPTGVYDGTVNVAYGVVFVLWLREVIVLARDEPGTLDTIVSWTGPGVALQALLAIIFQLSPVVESRFLRSPIAVVTMGPKVVNLFTNEQNNVLDPTKSGGFFVNGNVASLFGGVAALLLWVAARRCANRWLYVIAALSIVGAAFTGSKTAASVGVGVGLVILLVPQMLKASAAVVGWSMVLVAPAVFYMATAFLQWFIPTFFTADFSLGSRERLWTRAAEVIQDSPILGLGFGGWEEQIGRIGSFAALPPHNYFIAAWVNSGLLAAVLVVAFVVVAIAFGLRAAVAQHTARDRRTAVIALCAMGWVFIHGMADNTAMYGDRQTMILFALTIGYLYAMWLSPNRVELQESANLRLRPSDELGDATVLPVGMRRG
jgi:O-antigen ligase